MPKEIFTVKYDGQALQHHEMDVAILAPALMALGQLTQAISKAISHGEYTASLSVRGNIKAGSVEIELVTQAVSLAQQMKDLFSNDTATAIANFIGITGGIAGVIGFLYALILRTKGATPNKVEQDGNNITMHFSEHSEQVHYHIYQLYSNYSIRTHIYEAIKPLEQEGISEFSILKDNTPLIQVHENQRLYYTPSNINKPLYDNTYETMLIIESLTFKEKNKWTFHDGQNSIKATISDDDFLFAIDNGERFAKGDWLKVRLRKITADENGKLKTTYEVVQVLEHIIKEQYHLDI